MNVKVLLKYALKKLSCFQTTEEEGASGFLRTFSAHILTKLLRSEMSPEK